MHWHRLGSLFNLDVSCVYTLHGMMTNVVVSQMMHALRLSCCVDAQIQKELTSDVGNKHESHNAKNRKDKESYTNNLLDIHQLVLDPACQPRSFGLLQHETLEQPETPDFEGLKGQEDMIQ